jgi:predicted O-methyltransferase YrrM
MDDQGAQYQRSQLLGADDAGEDMKQLDIRNVAEAEILEMMLTLAPNAGPAIKRSSVIRKQLKTYQAAALYWMAEEFNLDGSRIMEIGTFLGYSTSVIAQAAPRAHITTMNPKPKEVETARKNLSKCRNVTFVTMASWDYYPAAPCNIEMVFVDGDHKRVRRDLPWWNLLAYGGLMLFHDYTIESCAPVVAAVDQLCASQKKVAPDVVIIDSDGVGMAGVYKTNYTGWPGVR